MSNENDTFSLPVGPSDLCFETNEFSKKTFSVDKFLQNHSRKANLESMRDDLGIYLKVLRAAMIELINKDYADFVNLSTNLIGLDKAINSIQTPLGQLREEVLQVKISLDEAINDISVCLNERQELRFKKRSLQNLGRVQSSLNKLSDLLHLGNTEGKKVELLSDPALIERAASEYNQLQFCISKCTMYVAKSHTDRAEEICHILSSSLDAMFLKSTRNRRTQEIARCLQIYVTLDQISEVEILFRKEIVAPAMNNIISESSLQSDPLGLQGIYSRILDFIKSHMNELLELTLDGVKTPPIKGFDFLVKSYWPEVETRLGMHLMSMYAPGNPEVFYSNYSETVAFLRGLEGHCGTQARVQVLHDHPQYKAFLQRWNLPVYFQIRFQEIAGFLESILSDSSASMMQSLSLEERTSTDFQLLPTATAWDCLTRCWVDGVFLTQLMHRFWKLSLQIIARYSVWTDAALKELPSSKVQPTSAPSLITTNVDVLPADNKKLMFFVYLYTDIEKLVARLPELLQKVLSRIESFSDQNRNLVAESLKESEKQLMSQLPSVTQYVLSEVSTQSLAHLRQVSDIPRLFRRTNREIPTKPCSYVPLLLGSPTAFHEAYKATVKPAILQDWLTQIFSALTQQFYTSVDDVLTSVQKTEESLRRLKKIRDRSSATVSADRGINDDDKIRQQLAIDVSSFCDGIESLGIGRGSVEKLEALLALVESARDKSVTK